MKHLLILLMVVLTVWTSRAWLSGPHEARCVKDCVDEWTRCMEENKTKPVFFKAFHRNGCKSRQIRCVDEC
ncbi:hypothetical protein NP493_402g00019 [Ridgeia piscesae]|uniref:Uncharacterized protein n=1 Tax=Ridgeia piscesae TaxID=27915 RepID=A0AAD9L1H1_RIDPI|nr:hypothetical protein NP493_402g00019 [Ridgeia piscesae]